MHDSESIEDAALERELQALLRVNPSPAFLARVRTNIADTRRESRSSPLWAIGSCAAAAAAVVLVALLSIQRPTPNEHDLPLEIAYSGRNIELAASPSAPTVEAAPSTHILGSGTRAQRVRPGPWLHVVVPPDDLRALERLVRTTNEGTLALSFEGTNQKLTLTELTIAPITTEPPVISEQQGVVQ